jgi:hypothetical protein
VDTLQTQVEAADTLAAWAEASDTPVALAEAHIAPALPWADKLQSSTEAHRPPELVPAAGRLAGLGPLPPPGRFQRHPQLARTYRISCKNVGPEGSVCHKKGKTFRFSYPEKGFSGDFWKISLCNSKVKPIRLGWRNLQ